MPASLQPRSIVLARRRHRLLIPGTAPPCPAARAAARDQAGAGRGPGQPWASGGRRGLRDGPDQAAAASPSRRDGVRRPRPSRRAPSGGRRALRPWSARSGAPAAVAPRPRPRPPVTTPAQWGGHWQSPARNWRAQSVMRNSNPACGEFPRKGRSVLAARPRATLPGPPAGPPPAPPATPEAISPDQATCYWWGLAASSSLHPALLFLGSYRHQQTLSFTSSCLLNTSHSLPTSV